MKGATVDMADARTEVAWADPTEVVSWAEDAPWEFLECRKRGFHMMDYHRAYYDKSVRAFREILQCVCCQVVTRENLISPDDGSYLEKGGLKYDPDSGYLREKGSGRIDEHGKNAIRLMVMRHRAENTPRRLRKVS